MSENHSRRPRRVSYTQLLNLWEFLNSHREIASGYNKSAQAREHSKEKWMRAASILNSSGEGAIKSGPEWSKYWVDLKAKIKRKNRVIRDARSGTGGGPSTELELTEIEVKFLQILGDDYGSGLPGVQVNPFVIQQDNADETTHAYQDPSQSTHSSDETTHAYQDPSQSTHSEEGSEEPIPIYLEVVDASDHGNEFQENVNEYSIHDRNFTPSDITITSPNTLNPPTFTCPFHPHSSYQFHQLLLNHNHKLGVGREHREEDAKGGVR